jgi:peptidoglycan/LPS O-acetylase OafA/YrhL
MLKANTLNYRPEIDGLRAVAVIPVIIFHAFPKYLPGGFAGVDVFFVISGFLITSIIIKDYNSHSFEFLEFWKRRIRRIIPALLFMAFTVLSLSLILLYKNDHEQIGKVSLAALFSVSNIYLWTLTRNYWGPQPESSMFLHTWSLSLEEQFYVIFPIITIGILKVYPRILATICLIFTILGYCLYSTHSQDHPQASFYLLPCRFWEIAIGCSIALFFREITSLGKRASTHFQDMLSWLGLFLITFGYCWLDNSKSLGWGLILPTGGAALFILFGHSNKNSASLFLSSKPMVFIGKISYSLYLLHWPIIQFTNHFNSIPISISLIFLLVISYLSYRFIETPFRKNQSSIILIGIAFILCATFSSYLSNKESFYDTSHFDKTVWKGFRYDISPVQQEWNKNMKLRMHGIESIRRPTSEQDALRNGGIVTNKSAESNYPSFIVMGDSHALMWSSLIDEIGRELNATTIFLGMDATFPFIKNFSTEVNDTVNLQEIYDNVRVKTIQEGPCVVILCTRWSWNWRNYKAAKKMIEFIGRQGNNTVIIEQPPELFFGDKNTPQYLSFLNIDSTNLKDCYIKSGNDENYEKGYKVTRELSTGTKNCNTINIRDLYSNEAGLVKVLNGNKVLYIDDDHLSEAGIQIARERIKSTLEAFKLKE